MSDLKRYAWPNAYCDMEEDPEGDWVMYDDAAARIKELERDVDRLASLIEEARYEGWSIGDLYSQAFAPPPPTGET